MDTKDTAGAHLARTNHSFRGPTQRYAFAAISVLLAYEIATIGNLLFPAPPLIFFGVAVAATFTFAGRAAGVFGLILATLTSDFFFVKPTLVFSLGWQTFGLSLLYLLGGLLSVFISKLLFSRVRPVDTALRRRASNMTHDDFPSGDRSED